MSKIIPRRISSNLNLALLFLLITQAAIAEEAYRDIYTEDNTLKRTLNNGMSVIIHEMHKTPIATIEIIVKTGSATEGKFSGSGISHLVEHMLFRGGSKETTRSYNQQIKLLGGYINAFTSHDNTCYTVTIPNEYVDEALRILKDVITFPDFDALELKKEKEIILDEIRRNKDNPSRFALDLSWTLVFQEHPYKYPIIGYEDLFRLISKKELEEYYSARYSPHNTILTIAGDVKKDELFKGVNDIFGPLGRNFIPAFLNISEPPQLSRRHRTEYRAISLAHVILSYRSASINEAALYPLDILAMALGEGEDSILTKELRNKRRYVHYIRCQNYTLRDSGLFYIYFTAPPAKVNDAITAILEELEKIKKTKISDADLKKSKRMARVGFTHALETTGGRARDIAISEAMVNDYNLSQIYLNKLLGVTTEEVRSAANNHLKMESLNIVSVLPEKKEVDMPADAAPEFKRKLVKEIMSNGIRVLICEERSMPICSISALFLGGVRAENNVNNGITYLISKLLLDGTAKRSEEEIKSEIESIGGSIETISGNNSFGIALNFLSGDWRKGVEIISDTIMNSTFTKESLEKEKALALAAIKERDDDIVRSGILLFKQNFFKEHPYRFDPLGTVDTIQSLRQNDIVSYYNSLGVPGNMVLVIAGDIDSDEVISEVKKRFARFRVSEPKLPNPPLPKPPKEKEEITLSMKREQSLVIIGFPSVKLTDSDRYIFEVIDSIMSGSDGRMFNNIRSKLGMSYAQGSFFQPGLEPGYHLFYALTSQENITDIKNAILEEVKELRDKPIPEEELESAKRYLIASFMTQLQRNSALSLKISLDELYGLGYKHFEAYNDKINSITASQIKRVANEYFNMKNRLTIIIYGDESKGKSH